MAQYVILSVQFPSPPLTPALQRRLCSLPYSNWDSKLQLSEQKVTHVAPCWSKLTTTAPLYKGDDQRVFMNIWYNNCLHTPTPFFSPASLMLKPLFSNPFTVEWVFSLDNNKFAPLYFSAADVMSMLHDCCLLLHRWFLWHTGSYYRKWIFLQRGCEPNHKVTRNKSSLAISVSLEPCAKSCGSNVVSPWSCECVCLCACVHKGVVQWLPGIICLIN